MNWLNALKLRALKGCNIIQRTSIGCIKRDKSTAKNWDVSHRPPLQCICYPKDEKPCFDIKKIAVERGSQCHGKMIRSFLYTEYWPREPTVCSLWMRLDSPYLDILSNKYAYSGDRFLAFERIERTKERKIAGLCVANKVFPWLINELEDWAHVTCFGPDKYRMYFCAHCLKSPNLFKKYNVDYIYDIEVLGTAQEVAGQGVGVLLLKTALAHAQDARYPLVQVVAVNQYTSRICEKCGMKRAWSMNYTDFVDDAGQRVFFPRRPHHTVGIYVKYFDPKKSLELPCSPPF